MKVGFLNLLTLIFVLAKLIGAINWSWAVVFIPTFVSIFIGFIILAIAIIAVAAESRA